MSINEESQKYSEEDIIQKFETITSDAERVQAETLRKILKDNAEAEYLQKLGLNGRTDPTSFKECVPLSTHDDYNAYIQRIVEGDTSLLVTGKPVTRISFSSGTTKGEPKYIPFTEGLLDSKFDISRTSFAYRNTEFPIDEGKVLQFIYGSTTKKSVGGVELGTVTSYMFSSSKFKAYTNASKTYCCTPYEVILSPDTQQTLYCHLLCGLLFKDQVQYVFAIFAHSILYAIRTLKQTWEEMCDIIRTGILPDKITDPSVRASLMKLLKPNPKLADLIHKELSELSDWYGVIPTLFPNAKYVHAIMTGSMESYVDKLRHYTGNLPLVCADYGSSESWVAVNVNPKLAPEVATLVIHPSAAYFEFIPCNESDNRQGPIGLTEVKIGEEYEIVVTTFTGLYRYQLGDRVKVVGFHNRTPEIRFLCRANLLLNINVDKVTERDLQVAVDASAKLLVDVNLQLIDYTSITDLSTDPGHYVIFWELNGEASDDFLNKCCDSLDKKFIAGYAASRISKDIGPLELRIVKEGTFEKIMKYFVGSGTSLNQYKTCRCVAPCNKKMLEMLAESVTKCFFSTAYD